MTPEPTNKFAYPPWTYRGYADRMGLTMHQVMKLARVRRLPADIGRVDEPDKIINLKQYAALQGIFRDNAGQLYRWGLTPREVVRLLPGQKSQKYLKSIQPGGVGREELKITLQVLRRVRRQIALGKKAIRLHSWKMRTHWAAAQNWHKREVSDIAKLRNELDGVDRKLNERQRVLSRLEHDAKLGRLMDNAKSIEDLVRQYLGEDSYQWLVKRRASDEKRGLARKVTWANKRAQKVVAIR